MPEGPSIILFKKDLSRFIGKRVKETSGISKTIEPERLKGKTITDLKSFGKHLLICFGDELTLRIHFLMFGTYRFDQTKAAPIQLHLGFAKSEKLNFYTCSLRFIEGPLDKVYDWRGDIMSPHWDKKLAQRRLSDSPDELMICDALLDQNIFAGLGNIMKVEALFITKIHPESFVLSIPARKLKELIEEVVAFAHYHAEWWHDDVFDTYWQAYSRKICPRDGTKLIRSKTGEGQRTSFWCEECQKRYV